MSVHDNGSKVYRDQPTSAEARVRYGGKSYTVHGVMGSHDGDGDGYAIRFGDKTIKRSDQSYMSAKIPKALDDRAASAIRRATKRVWAEWRRKNYFAD